LRPDGLALRALLSWFQRVFTLDDGSDVGSFQCGDVGPPVRLRLILSTAVKHFATRQTSIACLVWQAQRFCETFQSLALASESILSDSLGLLLRFVGGVNLGSRPIAFFSASRCTFSSS
jgi:hypothetical protein